MAEFQDHKATGGVLLYLRFMVLMDGFHCDHSCNDLDNSVIPHVNSAVI